MKSLLLILSFSLAAVSCNSDYTIKQRAYYRVDFPKHEYRSFDQPEFPYAFEYPVYSNIVKDTNFFEGKPENAYWINIDFPSLNGRIYLSYKDVRKNDFTKLVDDAFKMTYKHSTKATGIKDSMMLTPNGIAGIFFKVAGNAATARQFFVTDTSTHFLRGALYFDATPNADSLKTVNEFLEVDMKHLINTLRWR